MEISEIKSRLTLSMLLRHYGLKGDRQNRLLCPFHPDRTPSLQLYYKTHTCYCFSSNCPTHGKSMDMIDFIMHKESITKHEAILKTQSLLSIDNGKLANAERCLTIDNERQAKAPCTEPGVFTMDLHLLP